ncbi:MAG: aminotransferase class V-fold PLP-dependent enzyme [Anaerolineales bacterium]|nr:aminotransferase class V-fold PLP-dependent enzyme [Anaerolineales bacterium]
MISRWSDFPSSRSKDGALYVDNAATSWPKPPGVAQAMRHFIEEVGANPGRSGHRLSIAAARIVYAAREAIAELFGAPDPLHVIFGLNITDGINLALHGLLRAGEHVVTSSMEHNSVMRPLRALEKQGVEITCVGCRADGGLDADLIEAAIRPNTRLIALNHASNVCGTILPIQEAGQIARRRNLLLLVDAAQTAGVLPIDMSGDCIDLLAFTGHKSLYGPMGTGGLAIGERVDPADIQPIRQGGTGSRSEREEQPDFLPDCYESGTPNAVGLAGLLAALQWLQEQSIDQIRAREIELCGLLLDGLTQIPGVMIYGPQEASKQTATIGLNIRGMEPSTVGLRLDEEYEILCRVGLHCAPAAHRTLGTYPVGCVRFGLGAFNTEADIHKLVNAIGELAQEG